MLCPACGAGCQPGQKFCMECGATLPQAALLPNVFAPPVPPTETIHIVEQTASPATQPNQWDDAWATAMQLATPVDDPTPTGMVIPIAAAHPVSAWQVSALAVIGAIAGIGAVIGSFLTQLTVTSDAPIAALVGDYKLNDLAAAFGSGGVFSGTNLAIGVLVAGVLLICGGLLAARGQRIGAGLDAGAALALAPFIVVIWGNIAKISDGVTAQAEAAKRTTGVGTIIETRPAAGFYVLLAAAVLGLVAMVIALAQAGNDGRAPLNRALCAAGAIAAIVAAGGQLIPQHGAGFRRNFSNEAINVILISGRLAVIGLVALCGVMGFLRSDRWGIGLALGGVGIYTWQWLSSVAALGDLPAPPAFFNPGTSSGKPTIVTTIGLIAMLLIATATIVTAVRNEPAQNESKQA